MFIPRFCGGFLMTDSDQSTIQQDVNELANEQVIQTILDEAPADAWLAIKEVLIEGIIDAMPGIVIEKITGTADDFDLLQDILFEFYELPDKRKELLEDSFQILGQQQVLVLIANRLL